MAVLSGAGGGAISGSGSWSTDRISTSRRIRNRSRWLGCGLGLLLLIGPVVWILWGVVSKAVSGWQWSIFTHATTGTGGGLLNEILGTLVFIVGVMLLAGIVGIGCGLYISEMAPPRIRPVLRSASEVLAGIPSIVLGYVGYVALVIGLGWGYSLYAGVIVLSVLVVPYVAKATELALSQVPLSYREGAEALGMSSSQALRKIVLRSAIPGISTGIIVALAISVGETAPLLYTAGGSIGFPQFALKHQPQPYLTYGAYEFWDEPSSALQALSHDAALLLVVLVLLLILIGRLIVRLTQRFAPDRQGR
jgi:phosphate transport system permease protein